MGLLNKSEKIFKVCSYLLVIVFALVTLYPIVYAFSVSISGKLAYESGLITLLPKDITLQAYEMVIESKGFWIAYANTLFYTVIGTAWSMGISLTGAYALQKKKLKFRRQWNFLLVFTMWFSAGMIPLYLNYKSMHVDNRWGMVVAFGVQATTSFCCATISAASPRSWRRPPLWTAPTNSSCFTRSMCMSTASIATVTLFYAISAGTGTTGPGCFSPTYQQPLQVYLRQLIENYQKLYDESPVVLSYSADSLAYAIIICSIIPVLAIYPYIQKYFAKGVNMGGVKG